MSQDLYIAPNTFDNCCCSCSNNMKCFLKIIFCPCFGIYKLFACFWDERCQKEPYYQSELFIDNVVFCFLSIIDLVFVIIYKGQLNIAFFILRIISDSLGILVCWLTFILWTEEATDEDHMDPACCGCTLFENIITVGLDIASCILFFISDFKTNIILLICLILHLVVPIIFPFFICYCDSCHR